MELAKSEIGVVGRDLMGYPYNMKYPPMISKYGNQYLGYPNWNQEVFFYEFAVQGYDVTFVYHNTKYFLMVEPDYYCTCEDMHFTPSKKASILRMGTS